MTFVIVVVAAAGLALANTSSVVKAGVENRYSIQISDGAAKAPAAIAAARKIPGVARVEQVAPEDLRRTLERWLGPAASEADLPMPAIIDVDLRPGTDASKVKACDRTGRTRRPIHCPPNQPRAVAEGAPWADVARAWAGTAYCAGECGGNRLGGARRARYPSCHNRSHAWDRRRRSAAGPAVRSADRDRCTVGRSGGRSGRRAGHRPDSSAGQGTRRCFRDRRRSTGTTRSCCSCFRSPSPCSRRRLQGAR